MPSAKPHAEDVAARLSMIALLIDLEGDALSHARNQGCSASPAGTVSWNRLGLSAQRMAPSLASCCARPSHFSVCPTGVERERRRGAVRAVVVGGIGQLLGTLRAAPGHGKTLKRVPLLPLPHDGVSMACAACLRDARHVDATAAVGPQDGVRLRVVRIASLSVIIEKRTAILFYLNITQ